MKMLFTIFLLISSMAHGARFIVEANHTLSSKEISSMVPLKVWPFADQSYVISGNITLDEVKKIPWVKLAESTFDLEKMSLRPSPKPLMPVEDELFPYQWALKNQGQVFIREKDDITNLPMDGVNDKDIGWIDLFKNLPQERIIVAVLDSGVDLKHEELQNNLWKNDKECGADPKVDHDGNKLAGDCNGWNFTEEIDSDLAKDPQDNDGHGTHVSGIIAAAHNGSGIVGINPNALIMPVKVMKDSNSKSQVQSSESFALGIRYAVDNGAKVINLSLGWPRSLERKYLRDAVTYALSRGVVIVAAAGNNNSTEPLFPCAYDGVICTAASTLDGGFAGFSNYGAHVDTIAPGEGILSLSPSLFEPEFFAVPGFEIKSGTSQAAPMVSGLIATALAQDKTITIDELFARFYNLKRNSSDNKYVLGGEATWVGLSQKVSIPVVRPVLKRVRQIVIGSNRADGRLVIPVRNFAAPSGPVSVSIKSLSKSIEFQEESLSLADGLKTGEVKDLAFNLKVLDFTAESIVKVKVTVTQGEESLSFLNEIPVVRDIRGEAGFKRNPFIFAKKNLPVGTIDKEGNIVPIISSMPAYGKSTQHDFFMKRTVKTETEQKIEMNIINRKGDRFVEASSMITINKASTLLEIKRLDLNFDGVDDYYIQTLGKEKDKEFFIFSFYNSEMKPLWPEFQDVTMEASEILRLKAQSLDNLSFIAFESPKVGRMLIPTFFTEGLTPEIDQGVPKKKYDLSVEKRLYFLSPSVIDKKFTVRLLTSKAWKDAIIKDLKLKKEQDVKWYDTLMVEQLLAVSSENAKKGELRIIFSVGLDSKRKIYITKFDGKTNIRGKSLPQLVLQTDTVDALLSVSSSGLDAVGDTYLNIYDRTHGMIVNTKGDAQVSEINYEHIAETDLIAGHIVTFENQQKKLTILQTRDELVSLAIENGQVQKTFRPKLRYSFLTSKLLSELYNPIVFKREGVATPGLYVDSTSVTANRVYLFEEQKGALVSSIRNSLVVPSNCKALNPNFSQATGASEFVFLCVEEKEWAIRTFEMN